MNQAEFDELVERIVKTCGGGSKKMIKSLPRYEDLSDAADDVLCQTYFPGHNWGPNSLTSLTSVGGIRSVFAYGAQVLEAGKSYLCFYAEGATEAGGDGLFHARSFTIGSDGSTVAWNEDRALPLGSEVHTPRGAIYTFAKKAFSGARIYDVVKPKSGKIPLEISGAATNVYFSGLSNVSIRFMITGLSSNLSQGQVFVNGCKDCDYYVDCSGLGTRDDGKSSLIVYLDDKNAIIPAGSQYLGVNNFNSKHPGVQEYRICNGSWGQDEKYVQTVPYADVATVLMGTAPRFYQNFVVRDPEWGFSDGAKWRRDVQISLIGYAPMITNPLVYEGVN